MRSNCKKVKAIIREHIAEYYEPEDLLSQVNGLKCWLYPTDYHCVKHIVEGGCFLIYDGEILDFINSLGINPHNKEYDRVQTFELYCHLLARDAQLVLKQERNK